MKKERLEFAGFALCVHDGWSVLSDHTAAVRLYNVSWNIPDLIKYNGNNALIWFDGTILIELPDREIEYRLTMSNPNLSKYKYLDIGDSCDV